MYPLRGGIAQHTTFLFRSLSKRCETFGISFSRLYPKRFYPGANFQEPGYENYQEPGIEYVLDSIHPLTWLRVARKIIRVSPDIVLIPWWTIFLFPCFLSIAFLIRKSGIKLVFLCHNVIEHESAKWRQWLTRFVLRYGNYFMVHNTSDYTELKCLLPKVSAVVHGHPEYYHFPPDSLNKLQPRDDDQIRLLFFGIIRHYKGVDILIESFNQIDRQDIELTIVGEIWHEKEKIRTLIEQNRHHDRITLVSRYVSQSEVDDFFSTSDILILPYRSASGSAVAALAQTYSLPIISTNVGGLSTVVQHGKTGVLVSPESPDALARAINELTRFRIDVMKEYISTNKSTDTWDSMANTLLRLAENNQDV
jgi:glycosyltransferase involved in cell wall biosynthesis